MKRKNILKEAGVLLIGALLIFTSVAAMATTTDEHNLGSPKCETNFSIKDTLPSNLQDNVVLWDNYVFSWETAYHSQDDPPDEPEQWDSYVADDFMFEEETEVHWVFWQIYYGFAPGKDYHYDYNITFFEDDGTGNGPGDIYEGPITIADADILKSRPYFNLTTDWACGAWAFLSDPVTFDADTKYWISMYSIGPIFPQTFFPVHNESDGGILLHEGKFKSEHWGYPDWTDFTVVHGAPLDSNFVLGGDPPYELTISKGLGVTATITNNLPDVYPPDVNVTVNFTATGGFVLNREKGFVIPELASGTTESVKWYPIGFGSIVINVYSVTPDIGIGSVEETGFLILFLVL